MNNYTLIIQILVLLILFMVGFIPYTSYIKAQNIDTREKMQISKMSFKEFIDIYNVLKEIYDIYKLLDISLKYSNHIVFTMQELDTPLINIKTNCIDISYIHIRLNFIDYIRFLFWKIKEVNRLSEEHYQRFRWSVYNYGGLKSYDVCTLFENEKNTSLCENVTINTITATGVHSHSEGYKTAPSSYSEGHIMFDRHSSSSGWVYDTNELDLPNFNNIKIDMF